MERIMMSPSDSDDSEHLLEKTESHIKDRDLRWSSSQSSTWIRIIVVFLTGSLLGIFIGLYWPALNLDRLCLDHSSTYSPISDDIRITHHEQRFNASLLRPSIYRQDPSPDVDQAWKDLGVYLSPIGIDDTIAAKSRISPGHARAPNEAGGQTIANVEVFHQLHCLDVIRKTNYWNYPYYRDNDQAVEFTNNDTILHVHAGHCLDIIRQRLMCTADIGLLPYVRIRDYPGPYPDFNAVPHQCRNFHDIKKWATKKQLPRVGKEPWIEARPDDTVLDDFP